MVSLGNQDIEKDLDELPDQVSDALEKWRIATLDREKVEALLYASFKGTQDSITATGIKALINSNSERYEAVLNEITAEVEHARLLEQLLCAKKKASLRTAF
jgi:hypothetical protein